MTSGSPTWKTAGGPITIDRPLVVGIVNVTPDSFWDRGRGRHGDADALELAERLLEEGADILDFGGESTRPGATPVTEDVERSRVLPIIEEAARRFPAVPLSVDTVKSTVARAAVSAGAWVVNDVSGLRLDPAMASTVARLDAGLILMHSRGDVERMASYDEARYGPDTVGEIVAELRTALGRAVSAGIDEQAVVLDPGLGFAKRSEHSIAALAGLPRLAELGRPIMVGPSRKRFVGEIGGTPDRPLPAGERLEGTLAACALALLLGARLFRVHDVAATRRALAVAESIRASL